MMIKVCRRCRWHENDYVNCTGFFGNPNADIVFGGEAFGKTEALEEEAFVGDAGSILDELLQYIHLPRENVAIMNAMRCYLPHNPTPTHTDMDACFFYSYRDLKKIKPKLFVAMGASAVYQYLGKTEVEPHRGKLFWSDKIKCKVLVTYHPAACLYDKEKWPKLLEDFKKIIPALDAEPNSIKLYPYVHVKSVEQLAEIIPQVFDKPINIDGEFTGLNPINDKIKQFQFSVGEEKTYIIEHDVLYEDGCISLLRQLMDCNPIRGQDFPIDAKFLFFQLRLFPKYWDFDTCLAEYILTGMKENDLTYLTGKYDSEAYGYDDKVKEIGGAHKLPMGEELQQYGANDVGVMWPVWRNQFKQLIKNDQIWLFENITMPCSKVLTKMSIRGIAYDIDQLQKVDRIYEDKAKKVLKDAEEFDSVKACEKHFNRKFNPRSSDMIKWLMLDYYKLPILKETKKDNPSIGKDEMKKYAEEHDNEYGKKMELYRSYQNIRDNFLSGVLPKLHNNVAHTTYSLHATTTGRPNSKNPNLLNIPAKDEEIKRIFIARPGYKFLYSDLSQIEVRVASVIYYDENLIEMCNTKGKDFHCMTTEKVFKIPYDEIKEKYDAYEEGDHSEENTRIMLLRKAAKNITFGILYGMGADSLSYRIGVSVSKAEKFIHDYFEGFPGLRDGIEKTKQFVIDNGYADTYFKFRRRWKYHNPEDHNSIREGVNHRVQGTAWNLMQLDLIEVDKYLEDFKSDLIMQIYDALVVEAKEEEIDIIAPKIKKIMETINKPYDVLNEVQLRADVQVGPNLADLVKLI